MSGSGEECGVFSSDVPVVTLTHGADPRWGSPDESDMETCAQKEDLVVPVISMILSMLRWILWIGPTPILLPKMLSEIVGHVTACLETSGRSYAGTAAYDESDRDVTADISGNLGLSPEDGETHENMTCHKEVLGEYSVCSCKGCALDADQLARRAAGIPHLVNFAASDWRVHGDAGDPQNCTNSAILEFITHSAGANTQAIPETWETSRRQQWPWNDIYGFCFCSWWLQFPPRWPGW
ncbi:hypothetical protein Bbelb_224960 [Branchiostoma belcheri]|nr:hypothetical protein Bbelb_224960 [Branchiostoma belcheri]